MRSRSLTLRTALLFALLAAVVVSVAGVYLYMSMQANMVARSDTGLIGRVDRYRSLLQETLRLDDMRARPQLFENMLGNEQDILVFRQPGQAPLVNVNPGGQALPDLAPAPLGQDLTVGEVRGRESTLGVPIRWVAAMTATADGTALEVLAGHVMLGETRMLRQYREQIALAVLAAFLSIAVLGYAALRRGLRPLRTMAAQAAGITPGNLDRRLSTQDTPHELREVTASFNDMLDRLADGYQRLAQFSADLAHEIRTPIGALLGNCQVALCQRRSPEEYEGVLAASIEELERIARLVENILFLARADNAQSALNYASLDLSAEFDRIAEYFEGLAEERGIRLASRAHGRVQADPILFRRALGNLVANAVRYADAGSVVTLSAQEGPDAVMVHVENVGPFIDQERLHKLFDRFYRADVSRSADSEASGLGLSIVRAIMALHGGSATAECIGAAGDGASGRVRFTLAYPRTPAGMAGASSGA
ncbi:two-component sensor histidine kinase [Bordetella genomosp. 10]|uniref:Sensor protein n=1 Tax=Bordetella genomosp. 10 TaxID=1416804 RepID=A0A261SM54_9BORD|nr:heavy metal sensor histidine kinase [Bordetella genomosp. 10]OZI38509.1 two-component sensor histidine kinase [Bordetella genomosp. 10]